MSGSNPMNVIAAFIARVGQSTAFITTMAHIFFAYFLVSLYRGPHIYWAGGVALLIFGVKEFWFDRLYETDPPQTFWDNLDDFSEYFAGVAIAMIVAYFHF
jgi:putative Ca2+/H+ antiporter (TMEM165/GDT1 family)